MKRILDYNQTLSIVEKFMTNSRIREYCTDICKGVCCGSCYIDSPEACYKQEGRRLSCSIYVCGKLREFFSVKDSATYLKISMEIKKQYYTFQKYGVDYNCYFNTPSELFFKGSHFRSRVIGKLNDEMCRRIEKVMADLISRKIHQFNRRVQKNGKTFIEAVREIQIQNH